MGPAVLRGQTLVGAAVPPVSAEITTPAAAAAGGVLACPALTLDYYQAVMTSAAVLCSAGGRTGHLPSICRVRGIPVLIFGPAELAALTPGTPVLVDPAAGTVTRLEPGADPGRAAAPARPRLPAGLAPVEAVIAASADIAAINRSAVAPLVESFFMREEFAWTADAAGRTGGTRLDEPAAITARLRAEITGLLAGLAAGQRLTFRLLDLRSDEAAALGLAVSGPASEPNPELGLHGARRIAADPGYQHAIGELMARPEAGPVTFSIPFINDEHELDDLFSKLRVADPRRWGVFVETPAAVDRLPQLLDRGISVVNVGTKDLVQFLLAADRGNHAVARFYDTRHPAVMNALTAISARCAGYDTTLRIFTLGSDLDYYRSRLPGGTRFMLCTSELLQLSPPP
ncbi:MAG TPA: putative PEP-binding protein [Streptosporangiaceae bacterium]